MKNIIAITLFLLFFCASYGQKNYLSPTRSALDGKAAKAYIVLSTSSALAKVDLDNENLIETVSLGFTPSDVGCSPDGQTVYVTEFEPYGKLHFLSLSSGKIVKSIPVGAYPTALCVNKQGTQAWVVNRFSDDVSVIDLVKKKEITRIKMVREPKSLALSPDGKILAVCNLLPYQSALDVPVSAKITLVDTERMTVINHITLPDGSQSVEDVCFSKDGTMLFATHILSRYRFPTTQLERGWMNTNALSLIDVQNQRYYKTVLLDDMYRGAANPCGMALSDDGATLFVAASGTHELIAVDALAMLQKLSDPAFADIADNLTFMAGLKKRIPSCGKGARYPFVYGEKVFVSDYFSGSLSVMDMQATNDKRVIKLGEEPAMSDIRKGELYFADADLCFQQWQSCISCHPDARADGLNWDLINDGLGNPKNTKSMLYAHETPPCMITGIRENAQIAVRAGIKHIQFATRPEEDAACIDAYLQALTPLQSPYLTPKGTLSKLALQGKKLFEQTGCLSCHDGPYLTDGKKYDVGTGINEYTDFTFDTPTLKEIWKTAPYLYNGSAKTIREVLTTFNKADKHGYTSHLTEDEIKALEAYILTL